MQKSEGMKPQLQAPKAETHRSTIARRKARVPFNLEAALKEREVVYKKAFIPMTSKVVVDGNLITGQNPFSSKEMARIVMQQLKK